jgi:outer membrane protein TolC
MYKLFVLLLILNSGFILADENIPSYDLKQIIQIAKENNPAIKVAKEKITELDSRKKLTRSGLFPVLTWSLGSSYQKDAVYTGSAKMLGEPYNQYSSDLKLQQTLYTYGAFSAIKVNDYSKKVQELNVEIQERTLTQNVIEAFYRFVLNEHALENLLKTKDIIQKSLATANDRFHTGRGQLLDVLQVKTQLALIGPQIEQAKNQFENAASQLSYFMGEKGRSGFKIKGKLNTLLLKDIQPLINLEKFKLPEYDVNKMQIESLKYFKDVTLGVNYPTVKLVGDYLYNNYKKAELFSDASNAWAIQVQLNIPLFSGFSFINEKQILNSQEAQLYRTKSDLENSLSLNQTTSLRNLQSAETSLVSAFQADDLAEQSQKEASRNYKLATIDFLQFLSVEQSALQARTALDQLKYQSIVAYSNYFVASGQPQEILVEILNNEGKK